MKKLLLIIIVLTFNWFQPIQSYSTKPSGYIELYHCGKWLEIDTNDTNMDIYYKTNSGRINFIIESTDIKIKGEYKLFIYDIFGRKIMETDIKNPDSFSKDVKPGFYYIKIVNKQTVFNRGVLVN